LGHIDTPLMTLKGLLANTPDCWNFDGLISIT